MNLMRQQIQKEVNREIQYKNMFKMIDKEMAARNDYYTKTVLEPMSRKISKEELKQK